MFGVFVCCLCDTVLVCDETKYVLVMVAHYQAGIVSSPMLLPCCLAALLPSP